MNISDLTSRSPAKYTLAVIGLSGVGKTTLSRMLPTDNWFHYSVDYRIWTHYLGDTLNDYLKKMAMSHPMLKEMLKKDAITIEHRVHFDNLLATALYMGMLGRPSEYGSTPEEFKKRMYKHAEAEKAAILDIPSFMKRSEELYDYPHFLIDTGGSLCEVVEPDDPDDPILNFLDDTCVVIYIRASYQHKQELIRRAVSDPKPIYYRPDFLENNIPELLSHFGAKSVTDIHPKEVGAYLYPRLLDHRITRYEAIMSQRGHIIEMGEVFSLKTEQDLIDKLLKQTKSA